MQGFINTYDGNTGYSGLFAALLPLLDDAFGRKPKMNFGVGTRQPSLFEVESSAADSTCSFLHYHDFKGMCLNFSNKSMLFHLPS